MYHIIYMKNKTIALTKTASKDNAYSLYFQLISTGNQVSVYDPDNNLIIGREIII